MRRNWTPDATLYLRQHFDHTVESMVRIAEHLGVTYEAVKGKVHGLALDEKRSMAMPVFNYKKVRPLRFWGERCPVCNGTTLVTSSGRQVCMSCDMTWDLHGHPLGVVAGCGGH